ncbi:hypothetical protein E4U58_005085 [Claviceps cyperi]|nr:hypothetical protein E4U58_005085 [Claviceps cyperi]
MYTQLALCVNRSYSSLAATEAIVSLATRLRADEGPGVVGIDFCGDPTVRVYGEISMFTHAFEKAAENGLEITVSFAETIATGSRRELDTLLSWNPERVAHVIWEDEETKQEIIKRGLCVELCLSYHVRTGMPSGGFSGHHFKEWAKTEGPKIALVILEWAFGKRMTPAERLRKNQRMLDKAIRELDQTRIKLEKQEKTLIQQIKTSAKNGQMGACKIQAKDLVRTRRYIEKFFAMRSQLQKISLRLQTYRTNEQMMQAMKGATMALGSMNKSMNLPQLQRIAMEFERENDIMEQRQEMMDDAVDDAMDVGVEEEGDEVVEQVLEEIGVDLGQAMGETPNALGNPALAEGKIAQAVGGGGGGGGGGDPVDDDLQARLDSLKK